MPMIESAIDLRSHEARANAETMRELVADLRETAQNVRLGGGQTARERHLSRGKLLPRDRVRALIDPVSPFLEVGQLAARSEEHTSELQSLAYLVCRLLLETKKTLKSPPHLSKQTTIKQKHL